MRRAALTLLLLAASCGGSSPLAGSWNQERPDGKAGITIEFEIGGNRLQGHGAPRPDGSHDHFAGTYRFDDGTGAVTVQAPLLGREAAKEFSGRLDGDHLRFRSSAGEVVFHRGEHRHED